MKYSFSAFHEKLDTIVIRHTLHDLSNIYLQIDSKVFYVLYLVQVCIKRAVVMRDKYVLNGLNFALITKYDIKKNCILLQLAN